MECEIVPKAATAALTSTASEGTRTVVTQVPASGTPDELSRLGYDGTTWDHPWNLARGQLTTSERMPSVELGPGGPAAPIPR